MEILWFRIPSLSTDVAVQPPGGPVSLIIEFHHPSRRTYMGETVGTMDKIDFESTATTSRWGEENESTHRGESPGLSGNPVGRPQRRGEGAKEIGNGLLETAKSSIGESNAPEAAASARRHRSPSHSFDVSSSESGGSARSKSGGGGIFFKRSTEDIASPKEERRELSAKAQVKSHEPMAPVVKCWCHLGVPRTKQKGNSIDDSNGDASDSDSEDDSEKGDSESEKGDTAHSKNVANCSEVRTFRGPTKDQMVPSKLQLAPRTRNLEIIFCCHEESSNGIQLNNFHFKGGHKINSKHTTRQGSTYLPPSRYLLSLVRLRLRVWRHINQ